MIKTFTVAALLFAAGLLGNAGCNGNKIDCAQVCGAYHDCVDSDLDIRECTMSCESKADSDQDHEDRLEACERCIEGESCAESAIECTADCAGVIEPN